MPVCIPQWLTLSAFSVVFVLIVVQAAYILHHLFSPPSAPRRRPQRRRRSLEAISSRLSKGKKNSKKSYSDSSRGGEMDAIPFFRKDIVPEKVDQRSDIAVGNVEKAGSSTTTKPPSSESFSCKPYLTRVNSPPAGSKASDDTLSLSYGWLKRKNESDYTLLDPFRYKLSQDLADIEARYKTLPLLSGRRDVHFGILSESYRSPLSLNHALIRTALERRFYSTEEMHQGTVTFGDPSDTERIVSGDKMINRIVSGDKITESQFDRSMIRPSLRMPTRQLRRVEIRKDVREDKSEFSKIEGEEEQLRRVESRKDVRGDKSGFSITEGEEGQGHGEKVSQIRSQQRNRYEQFVKASQALRSQTKALAEQPSWKSPSCLLPCRWNGPRQPPVPICLKPLYLCYKKCVPCGPCHNRECKPA